MGLTPAFFISVLLKVDIFFISKYFPGLDYSQLCSEFSFVASFTPPDPADPAPFLK